MPSGLWRKRRREPGRRIPGPHLGHRRLLRVGRGLSGVMRAGVTESVVEEAALGWLEALGWRVGHGPEIAPDTVAAGGKEYGEGVVERGARGAVAGGGAGVRAPGGVGGGGKQA